MQVQFGAKLHTSLEAEMRRALLPFLSGPPTFDVGLKPIEASDWLCPDDQVAWIAPKNHLIDTASENVFAQVSGSLEGQSEAAVAVSRAVGQQFAAGEPPLLAASRLVSDDLVLMQMLGDGWTATALSLCAPTFFSAEDAIGKSLFGLHHPVPGGDPGLALRISRVFSMLRDGLVLERHNWTVQWSDARSTPDGEPLRAAAQAAALGEGALHLHLRVERQTIVRLPQTGSVLFTIRIRLNRLSDLLFDPAVKVGFAKAWLGAPDQVRNYKKWMPLERHVHHLLNLDLPQ